MRFAKSLGRLEFDDHLPFDEKIESMFANLLTVIVNAISFSASTDFLFGFCGQFLFT